MKRFTSLVTVLCVLTLSTSLFASGVGLTGIGARATALGGNFRAISNDWSAMFWNPAGLTQIKGFHVGGSFELIMPGAKYTLNNDAALGVFKTGEQKNEPQTFPIPAAGFVYGTGNMSFGLAFFAPFGLGSEWNVMDATAYNSDYPNTEYEDDLKVIDIHPTFAYQISEKLSVGLGVSVVLNDIMIRKPTTTKNPLLFDPNYAALKPILDQTPLVNSIYNYILTETKLEGNGTGFGINIGFKYNLSENLALGLSGIWYNDIALDGKISATTYMPKLDAATSAQVNGTLDYLQQQGVIDATTKQMVQGAISQVYNGAKVQKYNNDKCDATLPLPMTFGGGLAYTGINNLLISADVSWTQWSAWDVIEIKMADGSKSELVENWKDALRFGLGLEYKLMDPLKLRAGYYTEPTAIPDQTLTITIPDVNRRHSISLGASYMLGPLNLFASYEKILIGDRTVGSWIYNTQAQGYDNMAGTYKMKVDNVMLGLGYNF